MLRPIEVQDLAAIREIASFSFPTLWTEADFLYFLNHPTRACFGVFVEKSLEAYLLSLVVQGEMDLVSIATHPRARRKGHARTLLRHAESLPEVRKIFLEVDTENEAAISLYKADGFEIYGKRLKYYGGKKDAHLMRKLISVFGSKNAT